MSQVESREGSIIALINRKKSMHLSEQQRDFQNKLQTSGRWRNASRVMKSEKWESNNRG